MYGNRCLPLCSLALVGFVCGPPAGAAPAAGPGAAVTQLTQALRGGRYQDVPKLHQRLAPRAPAADRGTLDALLGQALLRGGQHKEAEALLTASAAQHPANLEVRLQLGLCYRESGQQKSERAVWNRFFDEHDAGTLDLKDPAALRALGVAARYLGSYKDANDTLRDAVDAAKKRKDIAEVVRANVEWAALFLEKYAAGYAEESLNEALARDADDPDARSLLARVKLEQGNDVAGAETELARALRVNPIHPLALAIRAEILVDNEQYEEALEVTQALLRQNPKDLRARSLAAAAHLLAERPAEYAAEKERVLKQVPTFTEFHRTVAELLTTQHRYDDAVAILLEAIKLDPKDYSALSALGSGHLRLAHDAEGLEALRRAWKGDPFNVRTYNLLELFEKVIPKGYDVVTLDLPGHKAGLRLRLPSAERALLLPLLVPMVQREWAELVKRYQFTPSVPLTIELFADPQHYAVRTVGLPGLAALGVTFGKVVTGRSPAQAAFNWGLMIWHEMSHVFAIQQSRSRVPRWFTEGLSEWETAHVRPEWTRRTHAELYAALRDGKLPRLGELNAAFTRAKDVTHIVVAYHAAAAAMDFLVRRFGFPAIVRALRLFAEGKSSKEVLTQVTGLAPPQLDAAFQADLRERLKAYEGTFFVRPSDYSDIEGLLQAIKQRPKDPALQGLYALALARGGDLDKATAAAQPALALDRKNREALLALCEIQLKRKDLDGAAARAGELIAAGGDGYDVRLRLGEIAVARKDLAGAERELSRAKQLDPDRVEPYTVLGRMYTKLGREADALRELQGAAELEIMDAELARTLVGRLHAQKQWERVIRYGEMARFLDPYRAELRAQIGEALLMAGRRAEAAAELGAALLALPKEDGEADDKLKAQRQRVEQLKRQAEKK